LARIEHEKFGVERGRWEERAKLRQFLECASPLALSLELLPMLAAVDGFYGN
jgi:hypothetical protein